MVTDEIVCYIVLTHYGTYYTGITNNLIRRKDEHWGGKSSYLRRVKPKEVIYVSFFNNRREAARLERKIKKIGAKRYLLSLEHKSNFSKFV